MVQTWNGEKPIEKSRIFLVDHFMSSPDQSDAFMENDGLHELAIAETFPDSKVHGTNMGPTWILPAPDGPHVGPMNLAMRVSTISSRPGHHNSFEDQRRGNVCKPKFSLNLTNSFHLYSVRIYHHNITLHCNFYSG